MEDFKFIDLFAGIGGMRIAAERNGGRCVMSSEISADAAAVYQENFGDNPLSDVQKIDECAVPDHDLLLGGFPCQPFSICGHKRGFDDTRGTLFFDILRIAERKRTNCLILENVKHFANHDGGRTVEVVLAALGEVGYHVSVEVLNAVDFDLPQNRDRTIIVASRYGGFDFEKIRRSPRKTVFDILEVGVDFEMLPEDQYTLLDHGIVRTQPQSGLRFVGYRNRNLRKAGVREGTEHLSRVHKQPNRIYSAFGTHPTLAAGESSGRYWIQLEDGSVRKLTMRECYRLQGFPDDFKISRSQSASYKHIGNSVPVPMISEVIRCAVEQGLVVRTDLPLAKCA